MWHSTASAGNREALQRTVQMFEESGRPTSTNTYILSGSWEAAKLRWCSGEPKIPEPNTSLVLLQLDSLTCILQNLPQAKLHLNAYFPVCCVECVYFVCLVHFLKILFVIALWLLPMLRAITKAWEHNLCHSMLNVCCFESKVPGIPEYLKPLNNLSQEYLNGMLIIIEAFVDMAPWCHGTERFKTEVKVNRKMHLILKIIIIIPMVSHFITMTSLWPFLETQ